MRNFPTMPKTMVTCFILAWFFGILGMKAHSLSVDQVDQQLIKYL
jgi:hypothetical protein